MKIIINPPFPHIRNTHPVLPHVARGLFFGLGAIALADMWAGSGLGEKGNSRAIG
jgi:hypothetical protein